MTVSLAISCRMRRTLAGAALAALSGSTLSAQGRPVGDSQGPVTAGVALNISQPRGVFAETTNIGVGLSGNALFRLEPNAIVNLRADASFLNYGNVNQRVPLSPTLGNLIRVNLRTSNNIGSFVVGPQLLGPTGTFTPYASALAGFSAFWTTSTVEGANDQTPFASTTNSSDFAWAYGGAAGAYLRVTSGARPIRMELGVRYLRHDDVTYLSADEVRASIDEQRDVRPIKSRVDFYTYLIGVQMIVF
jgi:hypothetical protein